MVLQVINFVDYSLNQGAPAGHESAETPIGHESGDCKIRPTPELETLDALFM